MMGEYKDLAALLKEQKGGEEALEALQEMAESAWLLQRETDRTARQKAVLESRERQQEAEAKVRSLEIRQAAVACHANNLHRMMDTLEKKASPWKARLEQEEQNRIHGGAAADGYEIRREFSSDYVARQFGEPLTFKKGQILPFDEILPAPSAQKKITVHAVLRSMKDVENLAARLANIPFRFSCCFSAEPGVDPQTVCETLIALPRVERVQVKTGSHISCAKSLQRFSFEGFVLNLDLSRAADETLDTLLESPLRVGRILSLLLSGEDVRRVAVHDPSRERSFFHYTNEDDGCFFAEAGALQEKDADRGLVLLCGNHVITDPLQVTRAFYAEHGFQESDFEALCGNDRAVFYAEDVLLSGTGKGYLLREGALRLLGRLAARGVPVSFVTDGDPEQMRAALEGAGIAVPEEGVISAKALREQFPHGRIGLVSAGQVSMPSVSCFPVLPAGRLLSMLPGGSEVPKAAAPLISAIVCSDPFVLKEDPARVHERCGDLAAALVMTRFLAGVRGAVEKDTPVYLLSDDAALAGLFAAAGLPRPALLPASRQEVLYTCLAEEDGIEAALSRPFEGSLGELLNERFHLDAAFPYRSCRISLPEQKEVLLSVLAPLKAYLREEAGKAGEVLRGRLSGIRDGVLVSLQPAARCAYVISELTGTFVRGVSFQSLQNMDEGVPAPKIDDKNKERVEELVKILAEEGTGTSLSMQETYQLARKAAGICAVPSEEEMQ